MLLFYVMIVKIDWLQLHGVGYGALQAISLELVSKQTNLSPCKSVEHSSNTHQSAGAIMSKSHSHNRLKRDENVCDDPENEQSQLE